MSERYLNRVSCKAALYTPDRTKVLIVEAQPGKFSLPGGHMEEGETPDEAVRRELKEELGVEDLPLMRKDFWLHHKGKLVLGYVGVLDESTPLILQPEEIHRVHWVVVAEVANGAYDARSYSQFICENGVY